MGDSDVSARRSALRTLLNEPPKRRPSVALAAAEAALVDPDTEVRRLATMILRQVLTIASAGSIVGIDLKDFPDLKSRLTRVVEEEDVQTRVEAISALAALSKMEPDPDCEAFFLRRLSIEPEARARMALVDALGQFDSRATATALVAILAERDKDLAGNAARALSQIQPLPEEGLPVLIENLDPKHVYSAQFFLNAIRTYGSDALPHLPRLEELAQGAEDEFLRQKFAQTIAAIRQGHSQNK
jgi:HEAT repeat protein